MSVEAGNIVVYDFYLLPCKAWVFVKDNLVLLAVLGGREREKARSQPILSSIMLGSWLMMMMR